MFPYWQIRKYEFAHDQHEVRVVEVALQRMQITRSFADILRSFRIVVQEKDGAIIALENPPYQPGQIYFGIDYKVTDFLWLIGAHLAISAWIEFIERDDDMVVRVQRWFFKEGGEPYVLDLPATFVESDE